MGSPPGQQRPAGLRTERSLRVTALGAGGGTQAPTEGRLQEGQASRGTGSERHSLPAPGNPERLDRTAARALKQLVCLPGRKVSTGGPLGGAFKTNRYKLTRIARFSITPEHARVHRRADPHKLHVCGKTTRRLQGSAPDTVRLRPAPLQGSPCPQPWAEGPVAAPEQVHDCRGFMRQLRKSLSVLLKLTTVYKTTTPQVPSGYCQGLSFRSLYKLQTPFVRITPVRSRHLLSPHCEPKTHRTEGVNEDEEVTPRGRAS